MQLYVYVDVPSVHVGVDAPVYDGMTQLVQEDAPVEEANVPPAQVRQLLHPEPLE